MPPRRRNADGSLVVPLSAAQEAALARGRVALAERYGGGVSKEGAGGGSKETRAAHKGQSSGRRRVETVRVTKASKRVPKATSTKRAKASSSTRRTKASEQVAKETAPAKGFLERWFTET